VPKEIPVIPRLHFWFHPKPRHQRFKAPSRASPRRGRRRCGRCLSVGVRIFGVGILRVWVFRVRVFRVWVFRLRSKSIIGGSLVGGHVWITWLRSIAVVWCRWCVTTGRVVGGF
jgi:hypothetical protein